MRHDTDQQGTQDESGGLLQVSAVELDEMAFAMALFFAAARGQVPMPRMKPPEFEPERDLRTSNLTFANVAGRLAEMDIEPEEFQLAGAVTVLWQHYEGAKHGKAVCSRLMAFYLLMVRSQDAITNGTAQPDEEDLSSRILEPAIIQVVATAPVSSEGQFEDREFRKMIRDSGDGGENVMSSELSSITSAARRHGSVSDMVQDLVKLLFACESTIARSDLLEPIHFRVFEKLCRPIAAVAGTQSLQPLLTRALALTQLKYSWLTRARVAKEGRIEGTDQAFLAQNPQDALRAELALMGSLVELLRFQLGDGVTLQLLRSVWPLAFLNTDTQFG